MAERVSSDHDSIDSYRAPLETVGRTDRVRIVLPAECTLSVDDVLEVSLDGKAHHAKVDSTLDGDLVIRRVTDNARQAREGDGENRLGAWVERGDVRVGSSVHFDVVTPGHAYGIRTPGTAVVYRVTEPPSDSLADIASSLEEE